MVSFELFYHISLLSFVCSFVGLSVIKQ